MNYRQIVDDSSNLLRMFDSLARLRALAESFADVDQAVQEAEIRRALAVGECERALQEMQEAKEQMADAQGELNRARMKAKEILEEAVARGDRVLKEAETKAQGLLAAAEIDLDAVRMRARTLQEEHEGVQQELEARQRELVEVEGKITKLRQQAAKLLT